MTLLETFLVLTQPWRSVFAQPRTWLRARPMRWLVIVPTPCRIPSSLRFYYRQQTYLLCLDLTRLSRPRLQVYFDRGPIEVNYREENGTLGIGQAQLWNPIAVPKQPPLVVAAYRALMLAALKVFSAERGKAHAQLPKWRRRANRPSCLDQVTLLRQEAAQHPQLVKQLGIQPSSSQFVAAAAA